MNGRFVIFGVLVSVAVHAVVLFLLSASSGKKAAAPVAADDSPRAKTTEAAPAPAPERPTEVKRPETPAVPATVRPSSGTQAVSLPVSRPTPVHESAPTPEAEWVAYTVRRGDTLDRLCRKAGCSYSEAARYNKTTVAQLKALKAGQRIRLPKFKED